LIEPINAPVLGQRRQHVSLALPDSGRITVLGDQARLAEIVDNLLTNASRYSTPDQEILVGLVAIEGRAHLTVRDDGMGIPADLMPRIFEMFTQGDRGHDTGLGLGLGLPLVQRLVELHGGSITAHSDGKDQGSRFTVILPMADVRQPGGLDETPRADLESLRVLVVDDNADSAEALAMLLTLQGHDARWARDGAGALDLLDEFEPELALLDLGMPDMDGYDLATQVRQQLPRIRLVALTGYRFDDQRLQSAGFDEHVLKPIDAARLTGVLARSSSRGAPLYTG
jgi:CheY-like chemotaxis protein/anti-sigma regulatory factor (Ser/Thr protein kinase)